MGIVNNILNLVDLNTTKYSKKLQGMRRDTKRAAKDLSGSFSSIGSAWKGAIAAIAAGALSGAITKELQATEKSVAAFISATGSVADARAQFEMLQQAARDTIQPFDSLKAAALELRKNGLQPSAEQLKTFSQIAYGTGQSLETVSKAFTGTIQGNLRGLRQLGITAQDNGETLLLTYKGATTEIQKNTAALSDYFATIGAENEGVLDYLQGGVTGALNHLENAWGDFYRSIAESGFGDLVTHAIRDIAGSLDDITAWINDNREPIKAFFATITESWDSIVKTTKDSVEAVKDTVNDLWESSGLAAATGANNMIDALSQFFNFARAGFLEVAKWATNAWTALRGGFQAVGEGIGNWLGGGEFGKAYNRVLNQTADQIGRDTENFNGTIKTYHEEIRKNLQRLQDAALGYTDDPVNYRSWEQGKKDAGGFDFPAVGKTGGGKGGGGGRAAKAAEDTWKKYFEGILRIQRDGYSAAEKLRAEHSDKLAELEKEFAASSIATEAERLTARETLEKDYQRKVKALREEAAEFLRSIGQTEESRVMDEYRHKMDLLNQYHEEALVSEQEYQIKRLALVAEYEKAREKAAEKSNGFLSAKDREQVEQFSGAMTSLSDAFSNLTQGLSESSRSYKALFAIQQSFAIASATANAIVAWTDALTTKPFFPAGLAAYANAVALTASIIGQLRGLSMHDAGGKIPAGQLGIVGEKGPEIIAGPASVTSRRRTAALAREAAYNTATGDITVNLYEDASRAGQAESETTGDGERVINIFVSNIRKGGQAARALESTYQLRRYGA